MWLRKFASYLCYAAQHTYLVQLLYHRKTKCRLIMHVCLLRIIHCEPVSLTAAIILMIKTHRQNTAIQIRTTYVT